MDIRFLLYGYLVSALLPIVKTGLHLLINSLWISGLWTSALLLIVQKGLRFMVSLSVPG